MKLYIQTAPDRREYLPNQARTRPELASQLKSACVTHNGKSYPVDNVQAEAVPFTLATTLWIVGMGVVGVGAGNLFAASLPLFPLPLLAGFLVLGIFIAGWRQAKEDRRAEIFNRSQIHIDPFIHPAMAA